MALYGGCPGSVGPLWKRGHEPCLHSWDHMNNGSMCLLTVVACFRLKMPFSGTGLIQMLRRSFYQKASKILSLLSYSFSLCFLGGWPKTSQATTYIENTVNQVTLWALLIKFIRLFSNMLCLSTVLVIFFTPHSENDPAYNLLMAFAELELGL